MWILSEVGPFSYWAKTYYGFEIRPNFWIILAVLHNSIVCMDRLEILQICSKFSHESRCENFSPSIFLCIIISGPRDPDKLLSVSNIFEKFQQELIFYILSSLITFEKKYYAPRRNIANFHDEQREEFFVQRPFLNIKTKCELNLRFNPKVEFHTLQNSHTDEILIKIVFLLDFCKCNVAWRNYAPKIFPIN